MTTAVADLGFFRRGGVDFENPARTARVLAYGGILCTGELGRGHN